MIPIIISSDLIKDNLQGYHPSKAELFHRESAKIADKEFAQILKVSNEATVILMSGGSASGKTEFVSAYLRNNDGIVFDSTLSTNEGAKIKIDKVLKAKKTPKIYAVLPDNLERAFTAFLNRDRRFNDEHFYRTHCGSRKTLLWIAQNYPNIEVKIFESRYLSKGDMNFYEYQFTNQDQLIEFLTKSQYTEDEIIKSIIR